MDFILDQPRVTTVSLWGIPLEMLETSVDENVQRFGEIKQRYKSKKNMWGKVVNTGVQVYSITLKKPITKHLTFGGFNVQTKYTGQDKHTRQRRKDQITETPRRRDMETRPKRDRKLRRQYEEGPHGTPNDIRQQQEQQQQPETHENKEEHDWLTLTEDLFAVRLEDMEVQTPEEHQKLKDSNWTYDTNSLKRKKKDSDEEEEIYKQKKNQYPIDKDIKYVMLNKAERLLPLDNYEGEFGMEYLLGLGYFMREGRIQDTEGYSENAEPDLDKYDQGGYAYLKVLSFLDEVQKENELSALVHIFDGYYLYF